MTNWEQITRSYLVWDDKNIKGFFGYDDEGYAFLSNFYPCDVYFEGMLYPSSEHAYMASKSEDLEIRKLFAKNAEKFLYCREARNLGQIIKLRPNWDTIRYDCMMAVVFDKFWRNEKLRKKLLDTGDKYLEETNHWGDQYFGVDSTAGKGKNVLGKILMKVRECLRKDTLEEIFAS